MLSSVHSNTLFLFRLLSSSHQVALERLDILEKLDILERLDISFLGDGEDVSPQLISS